MKIDITSEVWADIEVFDDAGPNPLVKIGELEIEMSAEQFERLEVALSESRFSQMPDWRPGI